MAFGVQLQPLNIAALDQSALQSTALDREMREQNALAKFLDMNGAGLASPNVAKREGVLSQMLGMGPRAMQFALPQITAARQERQRQDMLRGLLPGVFGGAQGAPAQPTAPSASVGSVPIGNPGRARAESGGNDAAMNPNSTAGGRYQFLEGTWRDLRQAFPEFGRKWGDADRMNPAAQEEARPLLDARNSARLSRILGRQATAADLEVAHRLGADGAASVMSAPPDAPIASILPQRVLAVNPDLARAGTAGGVLALIGRQTGGGAAQAAAPAQGAPAAAPDDLGRRLVMAGMAANDPNMIAAGRALMERQTNMQTIRTAEGVFAFDPRTGRVGARLGGAPGPDTVVNMDNRAEGAEAKALGERYGAMAAGAHEAANKARNQIARIRQLEGMMRLFNTGRLAPAQVAAAGWARALGLDLSALGIQPNAAVSGEVIRAMTNALTLELIGAGGIPANNFSNADREFIAQIVPQLTNTPEANQILMQAMRRMSERAIEHERRWIAARRRGQSYGDFIGEWQEYVDKNSVIPDMPRPQTPEESHRLAPGTVYVDPQGTVRIAGPQQPTQR